MLSPDAEAMGQIMQLTGIKDIFLAPQEYAGKTVSIGGWVRTVRDSKAFAFIELNDGSTVKSIQLVADPNTGNFEEARKYNVGSAIIATGEIVLTPEAKQPLEMKAASISM